jgi:hypothetical protein
MDNKVCYVCCCYLGDRRAAIKYYNEDKEYLVSNLSNTKYAAVSEEDIYTLSKPVKILSVDQGMVKIKYET